MNWKNIGKFALAIGVALGAHIATPNELAQGIADLIALVIAQRNRALAPTVGKDLP